MNRRLFLGAMAGLIAAPSVVRSGILMPVKPSVITGPPIDLFEMRVYCSIDYVVNPPSRWGDFPVFEKTVIRRIEETLNLNADALMNEYNKTLASRTRIG